MPTPTHEKVVEQYLAGGYRKHDFAEFLRLTHYIESHLGADCDEVLSRVFKSKSRIGVKEAVRIAASIIQGGGEEYVAMRKEMPTPRCVPDAWSFQPSVDVAGRMEFHVIEVTDFCPPDMRKISDFGRAGDQLERQLLRLTEVNARTGATTEHDPIFAWSLMLWSEHHPGAGGDLRARDAEARYAEHLSTGDRLVG